MEPTCNVFARVLCAVDDSAAGTTAARQAARITSENGVLTLVSVDDSSLTTAGVMPIVAAAPMTAGHAQRALEAAREEAEPIHGVWERRLVGEPAPTILAEAERRGASLLVIGSHGYRRATGIAFGLVGSRLIHGAPCSVLVARAERNGERWPRSIVVGVDGSAASAAAADVAGHLADRFGASLRTVACTGSRVDVEAARAIDPDLEVLRSRPVGGLHALSRAADLVVVGSRGLRGLRALGSVSERIAHRSECPVLVVRPPAG